MTVRTLAARMHALGEPMSIDTIEVPGPRPTDVLVRVKACGIVPNMADVINNWPTWFPHLPLPKFPAIFGLDAAGVVEKVGEAVLNAKPGDRVYVNPLRSCGSCRRCRGGERSASRILGAGRDERLLQRVKALAPERIEVLRLGDESSGEWARRMLDSLQAARRGGRVVNVGGVADRLPIDVKWLMDERVQLIGSNWFTSEQGQEIADMAAAGVLDLSCLETRSFPLAEVNTAISGLKDRDGGFSNYVVIP